ncbi:MAG: hypothetical protein RI924_1123 [Bacteroidota bacterium]|jgi:5-formyltetrahydrofolate cyclo-ligase
MESLNKSEARKYFLNLRHALTNEQVEKLDQDLLKHFQQLDLSGISRVHLFLPILSKKEVNTYPMAQWLREQHPEIQLVLSRSNFDDHSLSHFIWDQRTQLVENRWGITEPQGGREISAEEIDLILVPMLACDKKGHRVGYGKGFYDRFLAQCRNNVQKVGLSFFKPIDQISDLNEHDIPLDACITPQKIWWFA